MRSLYIEDPETTCSLWRVLAGGYLSKVEGNVIKVSPLQDLSEESAMRVSPRKPAGHLRQRKA